MAASYQLGLRPVRPAGAAWLPPTVSASKRVQTHLLPRPILAGGV